MKKYKVGLFPMCGDLLHAGHIMALLQAKEQCERLIVALNTHPDGKRPVQSVFERVIQLRAVECVDDVLPYQGRADMEKIAAAYPYDVRFVGADYVGKTWDGRAQETERGIEAYFLDRDHGFSSTELKKRVVAACVARK